MSYRYPEDGPPSDLTVEGYGRTLEEALAQVALGMYNSIVSINALDKNTTFYAKAEGHDLESLIFNLMDELLYINDIEGLAASEVEVCIDKENFKTKVICHGEAIDPNIHQLGIAIKAVTYHQMNVEKTSEGWQIRVVFDT